MGDTATRVSAAMWYAVIQVLTSHLTHRYFYSLAPGWMTPAPERAS